MYGLPSRSLTRQPSPCFTKTGVPPTALNARTGELTPPGMYCWAFRKAASELASDRAAGSGMGRRILSDDSGGATPAAAAEGHNVARVAAAERRLSIWHLGP